MLRVANINKGLPEYDDIADWYLYGDPSSGDTEYMHFYTDDTADVEFQYVEIGAGLPTWTPYHATMNSYTVWYHDAQDTTISYDSIVMPMNQSVPVDRTGGKTITSKLVVATSGWTAKFFSAYIGDTPTDLDDPPFETDVQARLKFSGFDSVSNRKVEAWGYTTIRVSDFWDNPTAPPYSPP